MATLNAQSPKDWITENKGTSSFEIKLDGGVFEGEKSAYLISSDGAYDSFLNIFQRIRANDYRGTRVRMSFMVKTNIEGESGIALPWLRIDGNSYRAIKFDNMGDRPIYGATDWTSYDIVMDVPERSAVMSFGFMLLGVGEAWLDNIHIDIVDGTVETTDPASSPRELETDELENLLKGTANKPVNLNFSRN